MANVNAPDPGYGYFPFFGGRGFAILFLVILILLLFPGFWGGVGY
ncbi:MAG: hypothetical protein JG781_622 [Peptococcaceae bacterium]|jgi:hypothetical protein|nr:hypothetical protein [Peptococcaceae bacterium]